MNLISLTASALLWASSLTWVTGTKHDFGTVPRQQTVTHAFIYRNTGFTPISIDNVRTSCGCTAPGWSDQPTLPGATDTLHVAFSSSSKGRFRKKIKVYFSHKRRAERLFISGMVDED